MKTKLSRKRAISTVLTTVIILVSSVVLGSGVVLYGTSLFQAVHKLKIFQFLEPKYGYIHRQQTVYLGAQQQSEIQETRLSL